MILWTVACQTPSLNSLGKNTGVGYHFLLQGIFPNPEIEPRSPALQADSLPSESPGNIQEVNLFLNRFYVDYRIFILRTSVKSCFQYVAVNVIFIWMSVKKKGIQVTCK